MFRIIDKIQRINCQRLPHLFTDLQWQQSSRNLYSASSLNIIGYVAKRNQTISYFADNEPVFKNRIRHFVESPPSRENMLFTQDIKNMLHLVENKPHEIELLIKALRKYSNQEVVQFSDNYLFGPVLMRLLHFYKLDDVAMTIYKDPQLSNFLDQNSTYLILLDLLFEQNRHQDVLDVYKQIATKFNDKGKEIPKYLATVVLGSCYKLNTPVSYKYTLEILSNLRANDTKVPMRAITFTSALALAQNSPEIAMELLSNIGFAHRTLIRNLKVMAFARLKRFDDSYMELRGALEAFNATEPDKRTIFTKDVIDAVVQDVITSSTLDTINRFERMVKLLQDDGHIDSDQTLDSLLCTEIAFQTHTKVESKDYNLPTIRPKNKTRYIRKNGPVVLKSEEIESPKKEIY